MLPYILLFAVPAVWLMIEKVFTAGSIRNLIRGKYVTTQKTLIIFFALFLALLCLRDLSIGCDLINYRQAYYRAGGWDMVEYQKMVDAEKPTPSPSKTSAPKKENNKYKDVMDMYKEAEASAVSLADGFEPIFKWLVKLSSNTIFSFRMFLIICALLAVVPLAIFYIKESPIPLLTIALFLAVAPFSFYFSGLRQVIAMGMMIPMYYCVRDKKWIPFILCLAVAMGFHMSAAIALALIPLLHIRITRKWMLLIAPAMIVVFLYNEPVLKFLLSLAGDYGKTYSTLVKTGAYGMLALFAVFVIYSFVIPDEKQMTKEDFGLRNMLLLILAIQIFVPLHTVFMRMGYYYHIFIPIILPRLAKRAHPKLKWLATLSVIVMEAFFLFYFIYNGLTDADILQVFPYIPFWK